MCATYGAGLSTACVVDVGEEKTHICCVEDGMSNINTRHVHTHTHTFNKEDIWLLLIL